jgi:predicted nucleic acid-binding protein
MDMLSLRSLHPLGMGELATVLLARSLRADLAIIDERAARRLAQTSGLAVMGCVGILETGFRRGLVLDLRASYHELLLQGIRIDRQILNRSLAACGLAPL